MNNTVVRGLVGRTSRENKNAQALDDGDDVRSDPWVLSFKLVGLGPDILRDRDLEVVGRLAGLLDVDDVADVEGGGAGRCREAVSLAFRRHLVWKRDV